PNINPNRERGIINVELAGVKDKERVRKILQSTANLQFWEVYTLNDETYRSAWEKAIQVFNVRYAGIEDTTAKKDTMASAKQGQNKPDTQTKGKDTLKESDLLSKKLGTDKSDTGAAGKPEANTKNTIDRYLHFAQPYQDEKGAVKFGPAIGSVKIKDTALFRQYLEELSYLFPSDIIWAYGIPERDNKKRETNYVPLYALRTFGREKPKLDGDAIADARQDFDELGRVEVRMTMNNAGASIWREMTRKNIGKPIAIVLDNIVYSAPNVITEIPNGLSSITGNFTQQEANDLAGILKAGKLPAPTKIVQEQQVGPTLGKAAIRSGSMAFVISFIVIFLLMLIYYNTSGWVANIALILNLLFTVGILAGLGATLTAPGIAGLVLTIGMAVDTNVIIYERIKEEITKGKSYLSAINEGYRRSLPPVLDAHITTLLTAIILFYFGLGPVKGFATTQIIGLILSMFCGILVSRWVTDWFTSKKKTLKYFTNISRRIFRHSKYKFIEYRKYTYGVSAIVLLLGIGAFLNGFDYGVEFNGGRSYQIRFDKPVDIEKVRADLRTAFEGENPIIKTLGNNTTLDITTSYQINNPSIMADSIVERRLMSGLKNFLPKDITFEKFDTEYKLGSNKVLPTISDDLKQGAIKALLFALVIIFLYIFVRFRDWRYSLGTIVALLHDVLVTLAVFSFARKIVPFPLEIDQHFIAAVLTVIGFSMNDTVIVFDRIREDSRLMPNSPRTEIINRAINETLSRTIMTSLTVFLTLLILFLVGGEVTKGFAFAMLIGVITGTYSSIFVAAPILVDLGGKRALGKKTLETEKQVQTNIQSAT
ncbi:MAG: protein translocase subunit SecD, partial [Chitinophagaceae bacterium]|nr:protein translocase subunit SecD [Chitinophagaceae bacterium]